MVFMGFNAVRGILTFALGGVLLIFALQFLQLFFTSYPSSVGNLINGVPLAFLGFVLIGMGIWGIIRDVIPGKTAVSK